MGLLVIIFSGLILIYYFFWPFHVLSKFTYPASPPEIEFCDIEKVELAQEVKLFFDTLRIHLERLGFSFLASTSRQHTPRVKSYTSFFYNGKTQERATGRAQFMTFEGKTWLRLTGLHFYSPYENDLVVGTVNVPDTPLFRSGRSHQSFPDVHKSRDLYLIHRFLTEPYSGLVMRPLKNKEEMLDRMKTAGMKMWEGQIERGLVKYTEDKRFFKFTFWGICNGFWKRQVPFPQISRILQKWKAGRILKKTSLGQEFPEDPNLPKEIFVNVPIKAEIAFGDKVATVITYIGLCAFLSYFINHDNIALAVLFLCILGSTIMRLTRKED